VSAIGIGLHPNIGYQPKVTHSSLTLAQSKQCIHKITYCYNQ